ncbi:MAG TPA: GNAT family N-acetyltransferase [Thermoanaerobaculia bacterium]
MTHGSGSFLIETDRFRLREMRREDLDFIAGMLADTEVMRHYPKPLSRDESEAWIDRQLERYRTDSHGLWLVVEKGSGAPVGQVGLVNQLVDGIHEPEIGYLIHRPFWRWGYACEAALGVRSYAWNTLRRNRVISLIRPSNLPSQGVARKLGMRIEKETLFRGLPHLVFSVEKGRA